MIANPQLFSAKCPEEAAAFVVFSERVDNKRMFRIAEAKYYHLVEICQIRPEIPSNPADLLFLRCLIASMISLSLIAKSKGVNV